MVGFRVVGGFWSLGSLVCLAVGSCFNDGGLCVLCCLVFALACCVVVSVCLVDASCGGVVLIVLCCIILCL